jgi:N-acetylneuraminic acid mutarotase
MMGDRRAALVAFLVLCSLLVSLTNIAAVRAAEDSWVTLEPMPTARSGLGVAVVDGKIYAIGGVSAGWDAVDINEVYNPLTDTWETKKPVPKIVMGFGIAVCNNRIHVIGGSSGFSDGPYEAFHVVYEPETDTWESMAPMPTPRQHMDANVVNGKIYVIGGLTSNSVDDLTNVTEVYDPTTDTWTTKTQIPTPPKTIYSKHLDNSYRYASAVFDNKIYVIRRKTQIYDTVTDTWSYGAALPTNVSGAAAGATTGVFAPKRIYIFGGITGYGPVEPNYINLNQVYNPETDTWTAGKAMRDFRAGVAVALIDDELFVIGGQNLTTQLAVNEKYTPIGYILEFPSWTPLLITLVALVALAVVYRHKLHKQHQRRRKL